MKNEDKIQLCEIGDNLFRVSKMYKSDELYVEPIVITVAEFTGGPSFGHWYYRDNKGRSYFNRNINKSCFKTEEEAKQEIIRRNNVLLKRKMLKSYERKLNEELNIGDHYIVK